MTKYKIIYKSCNLPLLILFLIFSPLLNVSGQESLVSGIERYYDFLSLQGLTEHPYLNYRTLSDSAWNITEGSSHPWQNQNLGNRRGLFGDVVMKIYGPELFMSLNTAAPYGQNDGALWQGKGFNTSFTGGVRFEGYGLELTFKPQLAFSQNMAFEIMPSAYSGEDYAGKAADYGYYGIPSIDAPQRFGDKPFFVYDWGDSEVRYTWKTLTLGFGTQPVWLGPAQLNPIIHSNNAPSYPKLDIGIRKQGITIPKLNWFLGYIELRTWWAYLSESPFFDNTNSNDHNLLTGLSIAYSLPFLPGFTIGFTRTMLSKWEAMNYKSIFILLQPAMSSSAGSDENDQRASVVFNYLLPVVGIDIYFEWARNDFDWFFDVTIRYPFHTQGYTFGIKKSLHITNLLKGEILLEMTNLEASNDYIIRNAGTTFYAHHIIKQGYTNRGQWLGAGIGTGGNSQYLGFKLYFPRGYGQLFIQRRNPDLDYTWFIDSNYYASVYNNSEIANWNIRAFWDTGISGLYYINRDISIATSLVFRDEHNPLYKTVSMVDGASVHRYNVYLTLTFKYLF
ncbi:MAG: capsule assembly Wzi family protein [Bacteroidales bacterium]|nr:capsule assembly Wzi family protein [Bacteroidales bacterium]